MFTFPPHLPNNITIIPSTPFSWSASAQAKSAKPFVAPILRILWPSHVNLCKNMYREEWIKFWSKYTKNKKFWNITLRSHLKRFTFSSVLWNWPLTSWTSFFSSEFCAFPRRELRGSRHCSDSHPGKLGKLVFARFANSMIASLILSYEIWGGGQKTSVWFCQRFGVPRF